MNILDIGWVKITLNLTSLSGVIAAITALLPPIASLLGIVYWGIMIWKELKKPPIPKDK